MPFSRLLFFFQNQRFRKIPSGIPEEFGSRSDRTFCPELGLNCLQKLADDTSHIFTIMSSMFSNI